jgi:hypothetical protein
MATKRKKIPKCYACSEGFHMSCQGWTVLGGTIRNGEVVVRGKLIPCPCG